MPLARCVPTRIDIQLRVCRVSSPTSLSRGFFCWGCKGLARFLCCYVTLSCTAVTVTHHHYVAWCGPLCWHIQALSRRTINSIPTRTRPTLFGGYVGNGLRALAFVPPASATLAHIDEHTRFFPPGVGSGRLHGDCWLHGHRTVQKKSESPPAWAHLSSHPLHMHVRTAIADDPGRHQGRSQRRALPASRLHAFGIGRVSTAPSVQRECSVAARSSLALMTLNHLR